MPSFEDALAAAGTPTDSGENWQWFEDTKTLFLTADTGDFTSSSAKPWDAYENAVETVYSSGVTGKYAFYKAPKLKEVYAYGSVMAYSYGYCDALTDIYVVNAEVIDKSAFTVCDALANVTIENAGAIGASSFTRKGLQKVVINGYDSIGEWAFQLGTGSQKAPLEVSITGDGTIGGGVFAGRELGDVTITGGKTESFFEEYKGDIYETATFYDVFWDPDATLTLNGVTLSGGCFSQGNAPASFVATDCVIGNDAFANAYSAPQNVTLVNCEVGSGAFSCYNDTYSLQSVSITGGSVGKSAFSDCNGLTQLALQDVESIDGYAFYNTGITSLHIQGEGTQIGNAAFCYNDNLKSVILDGNMTVEQRAFVGCPMETLEFRNCTKIDGSFGESVQDTTTIILPDTIESISSSAFTNCKCLQGTLDLTGVKTIGYNAFTGCTNITELIVDDDAQLAYSDIFPDTVANWEQRVEAILSGKFLLDAANAITQIASAGDVAISQDENGNTVLTWTISGMPFTVHTLSFQENLKQIDGEYPYGLFDTNEGDATLELFGDPVNTVPTPQLPRETEEIPDESTPLDPPSSDPEEIPDESTPLNPPSSDSEEIPDESTPLAPPTGEGTSPVWILAGVALLALFGSAATLCKKKESCKR